MARSQRRIELYRLTKRLDRGSETTQIEICRSEIVVCRDMFRAERNRPFEMPGSSLVRTSVKFLKTLLIRKFGSLLGIDRRAQSQTNRDSGHDAFHNVT